MFSAVIAMYRALGRPQVVDGAFAFSGQVSSETLAMIQHVQSLPAHFGHFEDESYENGHFNCEFFLPSSEHGRFHRSLADFIARAPSLSFGEIPSEFYIQDLDYYSRDEHLPAQIVRLNDTCRLIKGLTALAAGTASNDARSSNENRLLFVLAADGKSPAKTISLPIQLAPVDIEHSLPHVRLIELLVSDQVKNEIHVEERRSIMRLAVAEVLAIPDDQTQAFSYMLKQWRLVLEKYRHNVLAFVSQYAFEKVRKEIATAEIDHATKLSGVLGDIAGKLLALPVSLAAIILLRKAATREEFWIGFVGLCAVSIIFGGVLWKFFNRSAES